MENEGAGAKSSSSSGERNFMFDPGKQACNYLSSVSHYRFGGLDLFCLAYFVCPFLRFHCVSWYVLKKVCSVTESVVYLVPGMSYVTEIFPPQLLFTYSYNNLRV